LRSSSLFEKTTQWFDRANAALLGHLPCTEGCSHCCIGLFFVTILDRQQIQQGLRTLPDESRKRIERNAAEQVTALTTAESALHTSPFIDHWPEARVDRLIEQFDTWPCPALEQDGACGLYAFRPLVCRSMGVPSDDGVCVSGACVVQTAVPLIRLSKTIREDENRLARMEGEAIEMLRRQQRAEGEEMFLPYAFLSDLDNRVSPDAA
jgi:Fe-S-cluster containining protein